MSLILGIETSTKICSVAISDGKRLLALEEAGGVYAHAEKLTVFIQKVLSKSNVNLNNISAIAVSRGPGSYTGLRIGVSIAKGLCYALDIPLISVDTLQAMAKDPKLIVLVDDESENFLCCPMIDARRMEVYTALYDNQNVLQSPITAKIIDESSFEQTLKNQKIVFFGDGAAKCKTLLSKHPNTIFTTDGLPSAALVNQIAFDKLKNKDFENVAYFEPYYLKDFVATTPKRLI